MILALAGPLAAQPVDCPLVGEPPRIDGSAADPCWQKAQPRSLGRTDQVHPNYRAKWDGPEDLSGTVRAVRTQTDLYLLFEVRDDVLLHEPGRRFWIGDSIEVFLDTDRVTDSEQTRYSDDDRQLFFLPIFEGVKWSVVARGPGLPYPSGGLTGIALRTVRRDDGYTLEARIPLGSLHPLRPDADGTIGFDVALNDVDTPGAEMTETYMTLSGRQELYLDPTRFTALAFGAAPATNAAATAEPAGPFSGGQLFWGLLGVVVLSLLVRLAARRLALRGRRSLVVLCGASAGVAALLSFVPAVVDAIDRGRAPERWSKELAAVQRATRAQLDLDAGPDLRRTQRLLRMLRRGRVRIEPRYDYHTLPLTPAPTRRDPRYAIGLEPGESRRFPLLGRPAPTALRATVDARGGPARAIVAGDAVECLVRLGDGTEHRATASGEPPFVVDLPLEATEGATLDELVVTNLLSFERIELRSVRAPDENGELQPLPLATRTPTGVPLDVWHDRPGSYIAALPAQGRHAVPVPGLAGHRLWIAGRPLGAYPASPYAVDAIRLRVIYEGDVPGPRLLLRNGADLKDSTLLFALTAEEQLRVGLEWRSGAGLPEAYTVHSIGLDPDRPVARLEMEELGVLAGYRWAAATIGRRSAAPPTVDSGLQLEGEQLRVREETRALWKPLSFAVIAPSGRRFGRLVAEQVEHALPLDFGGEETATLLVGLPRADTTAALLARREIFFGLAALAAAFATVLAGGALLARARHLRSKMLVALGTATVVPLLFLVIGLTTQLNQDAESELERATRASVRSLGERIQGWRARVGASAGRLRDAIEPVRTRGGPALQSLLERERRDARAEGLQLRVPGLEAELEDRFLNRNLVDATRGSGLVYSPWDGLQAVGVARAPGRRRYFVAAPSDVLLGDAPSPDVIGVLYAPDGAPLASTRGTQAGLDTPARRAEVATVAAEFARGDALRYEPDVPLFGARWAAALTPLRQGGRVVGLLGVYQSRAPTELAQASLVRTLLGAGLAALLLVVLAGSMLVEGVTRRLSRVTRAAENLARGEGEQRVPVEAEDEVGALARSFNAMADSLDERVQQLSRLHRGLQSLATALDRDEAAGIGAALLAEASGANHVTITRYDATTERLETLHRRGQPAPLDLALPSDGPARAAVEESRPVRADGGVYLPLTAGDRVIGLAVAQPVDAGRDLAYLDSLARPIGIALENARLFRTAVTDESTGLYTVDHLRRRLGEAVDQAAEKERALSLLRYAIDNESELRRAHGARDTARLVHDAAQALQRALPARAVGARHGRDNFLFVLAEADAAEAETQLQRGMAALQGIAWEQTPRPRYAQQRVTYPEDGSSGAVLLDRLLEEADAPATPGAVMETPLRVPDHLAFVLGRSAATRAALEVVARVAPTSATVLLSGETGAGKEVIADLICANSARADGPFIKVNCAAIPESLVESELFGHEKGAFTGADRRRSGRFEAADGGTLFLDEIGDLPLAIQVKLLRVLQERRFTRVGGTEPIEVDLRILAATNRNLDQAVRDGSFREDLFHRLHVIELRVPPLRERRDDIPQLVEHFRQQFNERHNLAVAAFRPDALDALYRYPWPGNVRQLRNVIERAMLMSGGAAVERHQLDLPGDDEPSAASLRTSAPGGLTPRQERILARARDQGAITNREVVDGEQVSARTALRDLQVLLQRGLLTRVGRKRGAVYRPVEG
ncbi:MAG: sigma 54-interacting transcriptional regulator [Planctomycetota bacterium]